MTEGELRSELTALRCELIAAAAEKGLGGLPEPSNAEKAYTNISRAAQSVFDAAAKVKRVYFDACAFVCEADLFLKKADAL